jgi:hypothetical protein
VVGFDFELRCALALLRVFIYSAQYISAAAFVL